MPTSSKRNIVIEILKYTFLIIFGILALYPFVWILLSSFKNNPEIYGSPFSLPKVWRFENYISAWSSAHIETYFFNSIIISFISVGITLLISSMVSYVLSRIWNNMPMYTYFTLGIMIPPHVILIPLFILMRYLTLQDTRISLIIIYSVGNLSLAIFTLVGFMKTLPKELEEAAIIDGCSLFRAFFKIILPLSKPGLATVGTLTFLNNWNDYLFALVMISNPDLKTLTVGIADLRGQYFTEYGPLCAGLVLAIVPVTIIYILFQEQVIKGMTAGAVKG